MGNICSPDLYNNLVVLVGPLVPVLATSQFVDGSLCHKHVTLSQLQCLCVHPYPVPEPCESATWNEQLLLGVVPTCRFMLTGAGCHWGPT
jgi:hypothetical protein